MGIVRVENIRLYAYHGCLEEEAIIGSDYRVDVAVEADLAKAANSDNLEDTVDYVHIHHIVRQEMKIRSKLLEHVGKRIMDRIFEEMDLVSHAKVVISKINPPIGGDVEQVSVELHKTR
ncbi:dihydroneopterin aldolase [Lentiprolixibacter aurantiacus]|uniref:7,8-dihydroneopterin aldolase n=1 Tax=Lentiprolixibacter aurantiacus TaxID=2993939 RepID=A0AAE3MJS1_9FLAO|nr:dihydroneopterin aldolase [Lentiprolixibacter aurantiacus]MCX2718508.1 dihydroneopterin aldolase [Lentiprolixibacter aurantiacus]